ncbi:MAG TPA: transglycosylase domain-containing protein [Amnibacterium sp.]
MPIPPAGRRIGTTLSSLLAFFSVAGIAGVLVAVLLTPAVALTGVGAKQGIGLFESLPSDVKIGALDQRTSIYATSHGKPVLLAAFYAQNRVVIPWSSVPLSVQDATIAGEDVRYYHHGGVDANAIVRAAVADALGKSLQGASTITQQYVKNICVQHAEGITDAARSRTAYLECIDPSAGRKVREMRLAIGLEKKYTKNEILLGYLNIAGFGGRVYGIEAAAEYYFGVQAPQLTVPQAAALLSIVNNPEHFRIDQEANLPAATERRDHILAVERDQGMISEAAYQKAIAEPIRTHITPPPTGCDSAGVAGFFCDYVVNVLRTDPAFGSTGPIRAANLETKGWKVSTTLNLDLQRTAQKVMNSYVPKSTKAFDVGGAAVSVQPGTGRVVSMVQNKDYDASGTRGGRYSAVNYNVDMALGAGGGPQPGSTFKLFPLIDWLKTGHTLYQVVNGDPRTIPASTFTKCGSPDYDDKAWSVGNDVAGEKGNYTVMAGTAGSVNGVFASLGEESDLCHVRDLAQSMGATNARGGALKLVPAMVIGGASSIAPLDMATAYATIANHGVTCDPIAIDRITDPAGTVVKAPAPHCHRTVPAGIATAVAYALHGVITGGTMGGDQTADGLYEFGKTGTTDNAKDTWAIGSTSKVTTAVWIGNANGFANLRDVFGFPYCGLQGSTQAAIERHCVWRGIQTAANRIYGGATGWAYPDSQYLYGGAAIQHADARPHVKPKPKPKPAPKPTASPTPAPSPPAPGPKPKPTKPTKPVPPPPKH